MSTAATSTGGVEEQTVGYTTTGQSTVGIETEQTTEQPQGLSRPPCADNPLWWDLDAGSRDTWPRALAICRACPQLAACRGLVEQLAERGAGPRSMIWAGVGYDGSGKQITELTCYTPPRVAVRRRRVESIVRTGTVCLPAPAVTSHAPRREFVLGCTVHPPVGRVQ
jgi:hypothetical protein